MPFCYGKRTYKERNKQTIKERIKYRRKGRNNKWRLKLNTQRGKGNMTIKAQRTAKETLKEGKREPKEERGERWVNVKYFFLEMVSQCLCK
jgi:hypothetical protein